MRYGAQDVEKQKRRIEYDSRVKHIYSSNAIDIGLFFYIAYEITVIFTFKLNGFK